MGGLGRTVLLVVVLLCPAAEAGVRTRAQALLCQLGDRDPGVRAAAAAALGELGNEPGVIPSLVFLAWDPSKDVRARAADALVRIGPTAVPLLVKRLSSMHEATRELAFRALRQLGAAAVQPLLARLKQYSDDLEEVAQALGEVGAPAVPELLRLLPGARGDLREAVVTALCENRSTPLKTVKELLQDREYRIAWLAVHALEHRGRDAVPLLVPLLAHKDEDLGKAAAEVLGVNGSPAAVAALTSALLRGSPRVRDVAATGFFHLKQRGAAAVAALQKALASKDRGLRRSAASALADIGKPAVRALATALSSDDFWVRVEAAEALEQLGPAAAPAVNPLARVLAHVRCRQPRPHPGALRAQERLPQPTCDCDSAAEALGGIGPQAIPALVAGLRHREGIVRQAAASGLAKLGAAAGRVRAAREAIARLLRDPLADVRRKAAETLGCLGPAAAAEQARAFATLNEELSLALLNPTWQKKERAPVLALALKSPHPKVRVAAAVALTEAGLRRADARQVLMRTLGGSDADLRKWAAQALEGASPGDAGEVAPLLRMLQSRDLARRRAAARVLGHVGPGVAGTEQALVAALSDSDPQVVQHAAIALGRVSRAAAVVRMLRGLLKRPEEEVRVSAARGLGRMGRAAATARADLIAALRDPEPEVQSAAARALGRLGPSTASVAALRRALAARGGMDEPEVAAEALGRMGRLAIRPLTAALSHREADVRAEAAAALGRIGAARAVDRLYTLVDDDDSVVDAAAGALDRIRSARCNRR